jgi:hypothetical protein
MQLIFDVDFVVSFVEEFVFIPTIFVISLIEVQPTFNTKVLKPTNNNLICFFIFLPPSILFTK